MASGAGGPPKRTPSGGSIFDDFRSASPNSGRGGGARGARDASSSSNKIVLSPEQRRVRIQVAVQKANGRLTFVAHDERKVTLRHGTLLYMREGDVIATQVRETGLPLGFQTPDGEIRFRTMSQSLRNSLPTDIGEVSLGLRGSSIHGNSINRTTQIHEGPFFDTKRDKFGRPKKSDLDLYLVNEDIANEAVRRRLIDNANHRKALEKLDLMFLSLNDLAKKLDQIRGGTKRKVTIRLFPSNEALQAEGSFMRFLRPEINL